MASNFQSSFIPKESAAEPVFKKKKTGIVGVLAVLLFISSIAGAVGIYIYKGMVKSEIQNLESQLALAEQNIDKKSIGDMAKFGKKLQIIKSLVEKHKVVSNFLGALSSSTVSTVQFTSFGYDEIKDGVLTVNLQGKATSYASVALQEKVLSEEKYFKSTTFSNLTLATDGLVSFDLTISVNPQISVYSP
jgi:hypothetical protein